MILFAIRNYNFVLNIENDVVILIMLEYLFIVFGVVFLVLFFFSKKKVVATQKKQIIAQKLPAKKKLGELQVFYASQTGTAAKMANGFAEQAAEHGFEGIAMSLKDITNDQFKPNQISVFFMANTGEGEPPENSVIFMKMLAGKADLQGQKPAWQNMNYAVFGLGDTQYEHFNKVGIDTDVYLEKLGANRISKIGLGDANSTMEDDYNEWKSNIWPVLIQFRENNPYTSESTSIRKLSTHVAQSENIQYLSQEEPTYANYRFCIQKQKKEKKIIVQELDFKTKASLNGKMAKIDNIIQRRQNTQEGSSIQLQIHLEGQPQYQTASNIALWPVNDPSIVSQVISYFKLNQNDQIDLQILDKNKRTKFNFITPMSIKELLQQYIDLQFRITKGLLKKLSKFQSKSSEYFMANSSAKTTDEFKRLSQKQFCYLFKLVKEYQVKLTLEDFVQLSDSMGPRLFTIASCWKAQKNVVIIASIVEEGLISKNFLRNPKNMKAELRKSSFTRLQKWKKVIFIGAGTGFAPFRGYLQQKQLALKQNHPYPLVSLYFGCKRNNSDFIYRDQILNWQKQQIINKLYLAFSRQTDKKVYVQHLLQKQQEQLAQFIADPDTSMYICGSTAMGKDVVDVIQRNSKKTSQEFRQLLGHWQKSGKLVKELW